VQLGFQGLCLRGETDDPAAIGPGSTLGLHPHPQHFADHSILPIEALDFVVTADNVDTPTVYRRTGVAD
jgi:hypothetical protein